MRKTIVAVTSAVALLCPISLIAQQTDVPTDTLRSQCIQSLGFSEQDAAQPLYRYRIDRCVELKQQDLETANHARSLRLATRTKNVLRRLRTNSRASVVPLNRFVVPETTVTPQSPAQSRPSTRNLRRTLKETVEQTPQQAREARALLRRTRDAKARELCKDVEYSQAANCVREQSLRLGTMTLEEVQQQK